jgi:Flp pilus assembly protein TadG
MHSLARRFAADRSGAVSIMVAGGIIAFVGFLGLATDAARGYMVKEKLSEALDAAALAGGRVINSPNRDDDIRMFFNANFPSGYLGATHDDPIIEMGADGRTITVTASANLPTTLMRVLGLNTMNVSATTEVTIDSKNLEVALVLDVTGSMAGQRIIDLKSAANELIDIVVQDEQTPFYSKIAIIPYSSGVNAGTYAADVRGATNTTTKNITGATRTSPVVVTSPNHGFVNGDKIYINGITSGMTELNNGSSNPYYVVASATTNTFAVHRPSGSNLNGTSFHSYSWGGQIRCANYGCQYLGFTNASGNPDRHQISSCVSERTGSEKFTDAAPSTDFVGRNYPPSASSGNPCLGDTIIPLTSDKSSLHTAIDGFAAVGSTAGHLGIAWGWYLVSPNFAYLFPSMGQPGAYGDEELRKVVILMTDGEFNTAFCSGVIAEDSTSGSGSNNDHINCDAPNGSSLAQAQSLCANMKAAGVILYTVGFDIASSPNTTALMTSCATDASHVYLPADGTALKDAFHDIAIRVSQLRLSK